MLVIDSGAVECCSDDFFAWINQRGRKDGVQEPVSLTMRSSGDAVWIESARLSPVNLGICRRLCSFASRTATAPHEICSKRSHVEPRRVPSSGEVKGRRDVPPLRGIVRHRHTAIPCDTNASGDKEKATESGIWTRTAEARAVLPSFIGGGWLTGLGIAIDARGLGP